MPNDLTRLREEYERRRSFSDDRYSWFNTAYLQTMQSREKAVLKSLRKLGFSGFSGKRILEIGCGSGNVLVDFLKWGAKPQHLYGIDLLFSRLSDAKDKLPDAKILNANGELLPFSSFSFDIVLQYTALSSILDSKIRKNVANEMLRLLNDRGVIIWYDFWLNPTNPQTHGIRKNEITDLFGESCQYWFEKITLAPPIARRLAPLTHIGADFLESLTIFNSHWLAIVRKKEPK